MKITRRQLRQIIQEVGPGVGMAPLTFPGELKHATTTPHDMLAMMSIVDPTGGVELLDAALYALEGDYEYAAAALALATVGVGAGSLALRAKKMAKGLEKAGMQASKARKLADDVVKKSKSMDHTPTEAPPSIVKANPGKSPVLQSDGSVKWVEPGKGKVYQQGTPHTPAEHAKAVAAEKARKASGYPTSEPPPGWYMDNPGGVWGGMNEAREVHDSPKMKITRRQLRQIIKEELGRLNEDWTLNNEKEIDDAIASVRSDMKTPEGYEPGENERLLNRLTTAKKKGKYPVKIPARPTRS